MEMKVELKLYLNSLIQEWFMENIIMWENVLLKLKTGIKKKEKNLWFEALHTECNGFLFGSCNILPPSIMGIHPVVFFLCVWSWWQTKNQTTGHRWKHNPLSGSNKHILSIKVCVSSFCLLLPTAGRCRVCSACVGFQLNADVHLLLGTS